LSCKVKLKIKLYYSKLLLVLVNLTLVPHPLANIKKQKKMYFGIEYPTNLFESSKPKRRKITILEQMRGNW